MISNVAIVMRYNSWNNDGACGAFTVYACFVTIVFLIFDVELVLLFPAAVRGLQSGGLVGPVVLLVFVLVLLGGLGHEINQGSLGWAR